MRAVGKKIPPRKFVLRPYHRIPTWYTSYYLSGSVIGKGVVMNLSRTGMRLLGDHSLKPGTQLSVRICVKADDPPLEISRVSVQWANQYEFGVKIDHLNPEAAHRITGLINERVSTRRNEPQ